MATYGTVARSIIQNVLGNDGEKMQAIEATFEGTLTGNASDALKVTAGRFSYRE